jgi:hypothetical protein
MRFCTGFAIRLVSKRVEVPASDNALLRLETRKPCCCAHAQLLDIPYPTMPGLNVSARVKLRRNPAERVLRSWLVISKYVVFQVVLF